MIEFRNINKKYGEATVLQDINFTIETGEFAVMIGPSGCGKTTTLKTINRLIEPDDGSVLIDGRDISTADKVELRRGIGYVIQQIGLFPCMTVEQNIGVVPKMLKHSREKTRRIVHDMLDLVGMPYEQYASKYPSQLSGGEQQRVGVLRALAASPPIVLMDEPFGALDPMSRTVLQREVSRLQKKLNKTMVFVTHDMNEALTIADKIIFMDKGQIVQVATPEDLLANPANDLVSSFMDKRNLGAYGAPQTASDVMQTRIVTVPLDKNVHEACELMTRKKVGFLIVEESNGAYVGTLSLRAAVIGAENQTAVRDLVNKNNAVSFIDEDAQTCYDKLRAEKGGCVVVLNHDKTVMGIVTETSVSRTLADAVWGKNQ